MKNNIIIIALCFPMAGCYPGWQNVKIEDSVFKKPCEQKAVAEECNNNSCGDWFKKRATKYDANTVVIDYSETGKFVGTYFYCASGVSPFLIKPNYVKTVRNKFNPTATSLDYEKAVNECNYDSHKSSLDTSKPLPTRVYVPTNNFSFNMEQIHAREMDSLNQSMHELHLSFEKATLYSECIKSKGFEITKTSDKNDFLVVEKNCPETNYVTPCFIPANSK